MSDLGTISILIDVRGQPLIQQFGTELEKVAVAEKKVSDGTREVIRNFQSIRQIQRQVSQSTDQMSNSFQRFSGQQLQAVSQRLQNYESALANSRQGMNSFGVVTQQAGYQFGDFLVQVQSGTNWMVALGQQATQLVGVLPMMTGAFGLSTSALVGLSAGLGIAIPLITAIGAAWMRSTEESNKASDSIDKQAQAYQTLIDRVAELQLQRQMEASGAASQEEQISLNEKNALLEERARLQTQINNLTSQEIIVASQGRSTLSAEEKKAQQAAKQARIDELTAVLEKLAVEEQVAETLRRMAQIRGNAALEEIADRERLKQAHADQVRLMGEARNQQQLMTAAAQAALDKYSMMRTVAAGVANELSRGADAAFRLAQQRIAASGLTYSGRGGNPATVNQRGYGQFTYTGPALDANNEPIVNGGGGGGAESRLRKQIDLTKELTQVEKDRQTVVQSIEGSLEDGFMSMVEGTKSVKDAFKTMAYEIIKELYRVLVVQRLVGGITGGLGMLAAPSTGSFGLPFGRASGGSIMAGTPYLVGEKGPEIVIPRHSGTVVNADQTSKAMGNSGGVTVQNNITVTGSDAAMVRAEVAKMIPQITNATKAAVIDARLRGGQMKAAFS